MSPPSPKGNIEDDSIGGAVSSVLRSSLRSLGDIDVVTSRENADFYLDGIAICNDACADWSAVNFAFRLYTRFTEESIRGSAGVYKLKLADSTVRRIVQVFDTAEQTHLTWVVKWGRARYEQAAREFIAEIDNRCLERTRIAQRLDATKAVEAREALVNALLDPRRPRC